MTHALPGPGDRRDAETEPGSWLSRSADETERAGEGLASALAAGDVIALSGPLGAGKSRVVAGLARGLGHRGPTRSPTFTLVNEYGGRILLFHVDLYRIDSADAVTLGLDEALERGALAVEWGEKLPAGFLESALMITIEPRAGDERGITVRGDGTPRAQRLLAAWHAAIGRVRCP